FRHGEAENEAGKLAVSRRGVAQRALEELTEQVTHTDRGQAGIDRGDAGADELCCFSFHGDAPLRFGNGLRDDFRRQGRVSVERQWPSGCSASAMYMQVSMANT